MPSSSFTRSRPLLPDTGGHYTSMKVLPCQLVHLFSSPHAASLTPHTSSPRAAGLDIGSTTSKLVVIADGRIVHSAVTATGTEPRRRIQEFIEQAGPEARLAITGYGRHLAAGALEARVISEISAVAAGAAAVCTEARTVLDIGGQDTKVVLLADAGVVQDFVMNDRCAAGTGRFLEVMSRALAMPLERLDAAASAAAEEVRISSMCAVYAESEVVGLLAAGTPPEALARGLMRAMAARLAADLKRTGCRPPVLATGGGALFRSLRSFIEHELGMPLAVPEQPQLVAAIGAARVAGVSGD